jgi:hypothetical protein
VLRQLVILEWSGLTFGLALRLVPAIAGVLTLGLLLGNPEAGAIASGGALVVGFGAFQQFAESRAVAMVLAGIGIALSSFIGTLAGNSTVAMALVALVYGFNCGLLPAVGMGAFWVGQQCTVFLIIAGAYSGGLGAALERTLLVSAGGALQLVCFALILFVERGALRVPGLAAALFAERAALARLVAHLDWRSPYFQFALRLSAALGMAVVIERWLAIPNGYWVTMTVILLMRLDFHDTLARCLGRSGGTVAGAGLATLIAVALHPSPLALAILVACFAGIAYGTLRLNYGIYSLFLTAYVVFLLTLAGLTEATTAEDRIIGTLIGAAFALAAHANFYRITRRSRAAPD